VALIRSAGSYMIPTIIGNSRTVSLGAITKRLVPVFCDAIVSKYVGVTESDVYSVKVLSFEKSRVTTTRPTTLSSWM
jgi:hypothetical protein